MEKNYGKKHKEFSKNKQKYPLYVGITMNENTISSFKNKIIEFYKILKEKYSELNDNFNELSNILLDNDNGDNKVSFKVVKSFHITTLFLGKKKKNGGSDNLFNKYNSIQSKILKEEPIQFKLLGIVIIPNKICASLVDTDEECENKFPHITIYFTEEYHAKDSNLILTEIFDSGKLLENQYINIINGKMDEYIDKISTKINGKEEIIYVYMFNNGNNALSGFLKDYYY